MHTAARLLALACLVPMLSGCVAVAVVETTATVASTTVGVATDVAGAAVHTVTGSDDDKDDDKGK